MRPEVTSHWIVGSRLPIIIYAFSKNPKLHHLIDGIPNARPEFSDKNVGSISKHGVIFEKTMTEKSVFAKVRREAVA
jgi:hypothetical protein